MYSKYSTALMSRHGFSFDNTLIELVRNGNQTGIYPDVALLLYELSCAPDTRFVLEFGSGMSTLVMAHAMGKVGNRLLTIENHPKWFGITERSLVGLGLRGYVEYVCTHDDVAQCPAIKDLASVVFIDGRILSSFGDQSGSRLKTCEFYWEVIKDSVLVFDDAQASDISSWLNSTRKTDFTNVMFNPTGRGDRQVLISCPADKSSYLSVVGYCSKL